LHLAFASLLPGNGDRNCLTLYMLMTIATDVPRAMAHDKPIFSLIKEILKENIDRKETTQMSLPKGCPDNLKHIGP